MSYSIIEVWEVQQMDSEGRYFEKHISYHSSKEEAKVAANKYYDVQPRAAIQIDNDIYLLANGVGYNRPITVKENHE